MLYYYVIFFYLNNQYFIVYIYIKFLNTDFYIGNILMYILKYMYWNV